MKKGQLNSNFHTHTFRCGHAIGGTEDYVKSAVSLGYKNLGISDHIFLPTIHHPGMRGDFEELDDYIHDFTKSKKKYGSKINLYLGFEAEYMKQFEGYYKSLFNKYHLDYLILGQHFVYDKKGSVIPYFNDSKLNDVESLLRYKNDLIDGMKSGLFLYVAHPDLFMGYVNEINDQIISIMNDIIDASIKYDLPLELNLGGLRFNTYLSLIRGTYAYPNHEFWKLASEKGSKVVVGVDAHNPKDLDLLPDWFATKFIKAHNLNIVDPLEVYFNKKVEYLKKRSE